jgi:hypothetical protein
MKLELLLAKLEDVKVSVDRESREDDGRRVIVLTSLLDFFPLMPHRRWYSLILESGQTDVDEREIEAILRHVWHREQDWFSEGEEH